MSLTHDDRRSSPAFASPAAGKARGGLSLILVLSAVMLLTAKRDITRSGNESSRLATVQSVVEQGTFAIDQSRFDTVDKVLIDGRYYSVRPVLYSYWLIAVYLVLHHLFHLDFQSSYHLVIYLLNVLGSGVFSVLLAYLFYRRLAAVDLARGVRAILSASVVLTTWVYSYGVLINNHTPAACALAAVFFLVEGSLNQPAPAAFLTAGLLVGILFNLDLPTGAIFAAGFAAAILSSGNPRKFRMLAAYGGGFGTMILLMMALDYLAYGRVLPAYLVAGAFDFPGNIHSRSIAGLHTPESVPWYLFHITFGLRGLFLHMPALLFFLPSLKPGSRTIGRFESIMLLSCLAVLLFYGTRTGDFGGWAYGFRFVIPLIPLLFWFAVSWLAANRTLFRAAVFSICLAVGFITSQVGAYNPWPVVFEGASSAQTSLERHFRSPFAANLLAISFELDPHGPLTGFLSRHVFDENLVAPYLRKAYRNMNRSDMAETVPVR